MNYKLTHWFTFGSAPVRAVCNTASHAFVYGPTGASLVMIGKHPYWMGGLGNFMEVNFEELDPEIQLLFVTETLVGE